MLNGGHWRADRYITFRRDDHPAQPYQQIIYDSDGLVTTEVTYLDYKEFDGILFPTLIKVKLIQEDIDFDFQIDDATFNKPLKEDQFKLTPPAGAQIVNAR